MESRDGLTISNKNPRKRHDRDLMQERVTDRAWTEFGVAANIRAPGGHFTLIQLQHSFTITAGTALFYE